MELVAASTRAAWWRGVASWAPLIIAALLFTVGAPRSWLKLTRIPVLVPPADRPVLQLPWAPLLTGEEQRRGVSHYGGGARLRALAGELLRGQPITAVTLGGSNTYGHGVDDQSLAYPARFLDFINASWPHRSHVLVNLPGITATAPCLASLVPPGADLLVVEFSINESPAGGVRDRHAYEWLLRDLLALPGNPAVVILHSYRWWRAAGDGQTEGLFYMEPEPQLELFAHYYDLPSLSMREAAWHLMRAGVDGFKIDRVLLPGALEGRHWKEIPRATPGSENSYAYMDTVHPSPTGTSCWPSCWQGC